MGPPPFGDGNILCEVHTSYCSPPSMGPPPFGDGNWPHGLLLHQIRRPFNGATAFRRWKPSCSKPSRCTGSTFNGATAFRRWKLNLMIDYARTTNHLQWGHRLSAMETTTSKEEALALGFLQWGHRLSAMETARRLTRKKPSSTAFNGATAFRRWNLCRKGNQGRLHPSMGPPPFGDGNVRTQDALRL